MGATAMGSERQGDGVGQSRSSSSEDGGDRHDGEGEPEDRDGDRSSSRAKVELELEKLRYEIQGLQRRIGPEAEKLAAELRELNRPLWLKNIAPAVTLLAAVIGIGGSIWINQIIASKESAQRAQETIAKTLVTRLAERSSIQRIAAAQQYGQVDPDVAWLILEQEWAASPTRGGPRSSGASNERELTLRVGIMEAAGLPEGRSRISRERRRDLLVRGLKDAEPLVRYKALLGLMSIQAVGDIQSYFAEVQSRMPRRERYRRQYEMIDVPAGVAVLGSDDDEKAEAPAQQVSFGAFLIDARSVTNGQWNAVMGESTAPSFEEVMGSKLSRWRRHRDNVDRPLVGASQLDATRFCQKSGGRRLPTELEWEVAARGTDGWPFPWGSDSDITAAVLSKQKAATGVKGNDRDMLGVRLNIPHALDRSPLGVEGMTTGVREWTGTEHSSSHPVPYKKNNGCKTECVVKGAAGFEDMYSEDERRMRSSRRDRRLAKNGDDLIGFRCALSRKEDRS
ncbi:formylglycine-generating enzyme family protein [Piscinibacter gummiphilus]|uniref:formylglycine-generating enzyme family protein n=1 Tax=Piscinibacter gummiphilus TaxID=946333 RepID=UPI000A271C83|nr:SUMF1/EgtB/PvdO family nonheme iron enzyme [Piscinibacter gummiphilus]ATU65764.1 hypothetical protein CPZ87_15030 [Piscinibacter gummiphilus]GLS93634.1 hypothetical protein GCM10007918_09250 [Piscinibacter gummiphilus]